MSKFAIRNKKKKHKNVVDVQSRTGGDAAGKTLGPNTTEPRMRCKFHSGILKAKVAA
jgi:hypothetical protein